MTTNFTFTSIDALMERLAANKYTKNLKKDVVIQMVADFYSKCDFREMYVQKVSEVKISQHKGFLPCGCISVIQVKDLDTGKCITSSLDNFFLDTKHIKGTDSFKIQGNVIITSKPFGVMQVSYLSFPVDEHDEPMLPDYNLFLLTVESYIKKEVYFELFEDSKINANVYDVIEKEYYFNKGQLTAEFNMPSLSEYEALGNAVNKPLWPDGKDFVEGFAKANYINKYRIHR